MCEGKANCATCGTSETCGLLSIQVVDYMLMVVVHSYLRGDKYLYKVVDQPSDLHAFFF